MRAIDDMVGWRTLYGDDFEPEMVPEYIHADSTGRDMLNDSSDRYTTPADSASLLARRTYSLALACIKAAPLLNAKHQYDLARQLLRSGTNPGAMLQEYRYAESKADKRHKLAIGLKEAAETRYWICLCFDAELLSKGAFEELIDVVNPVISLFSRAHRSLS